MPRVARVAVDIPLAHVDRLFDYEIPDSLAETAQPGVRVKVSFGGSLKDGWIIELADHTEAPKLVKLKKVVSPERVVDDKLYQLIRAVADHYAEPECLWGALTCFCARRGGVALRPVTACIKCVRVELIKVRASDTSIWDFHL